jgi:hypothetical protein
MSQNFDDILSDINKNRDINLKYSDNSRINYIQNFIKDNNIVEGKDAVPVIYIYSLYCEQLRPPMPRRSFAKLFKTLFKRQNAGKIHFYRLDRTPFKMPANYTIWKELGKFKFEYKKSKFKNIKHTPEGWMVYLDYETGRRIYGFYKTPIKAARIADQIALFYYGPNYDKLNFSDTKLKEDAKLLEILQGKFLNEKTKR